MAGGEVTIERMARYDRIAEWYDANFAESDWGQTMRAVAVRLLGTGPGRLLDVGCGTGAHDDAFAEGGWTVTGVDISAAQLRLARDRGVDVVQADATQLPFGDGSFDGVVSLGTHTDFDDFAAAMREAARVLKPGGILVYVGVHPCFVGPHSWYDDGGRPILHPGYRDTTRRSEAHGIWSEGLRAKVGAVHLPLACFVQAFLDAGLVLERFEEPDDREYPKLVALRARR
jgi:SAM-dependent methyltransferase